MKQIRYFILLLSLIVYISTDDDDVDIDLTSGCYAVNSPSKDNCTAYTLSASEKKYADTCCYYSSDQQKSCYPIKKKKVKDYIKSNEKAGDTNVSIDCNSNWLNLGFSLVILVLFL